MPRWRLAARSARWFSARDAMMSRMPSAEFQSLSIKVEPGASGRLLTATGEIDSLTSPELQASVDQALPDPGQVLVVDLSGVTFLSSAGLSVLVEAHLRAEDAGYEVRIVTNANSARVFQLTGLHETLRLYGTLAEAQA
jgi:anti-sigma B factor antagonist